jgi:hypothetical protein
MRVLRGARLVCAMNLLRYGLYVQCCGYKYVGGHEKEK